jgi:hypothetical protein
MSIGKGFEYICVRFGRLFSSVFPGFVLGGGEAILTLFSGCLAPFWLSTDPFILFKTG